MREADSLVQLAALTRQEREPRNYTAKRAALVFVLSHGEFASLRGLETPCKPLDELSVEARLRSKTYVRNARAHGNVAKYIMNAGNLYDSFFGGGATRTEYLRHAVAARESEWWHRLSGAIVEVHICAYRLTQGFSCSLTGFQKAADLGFSVPEILKEMKKLQKEVDQHLKESGDLPLDLGGSDDDEDDDVGDGSDTAGTPSPRNVRTRNANGNGNGPSVPIADFAVIF